MRNERAIHDMQTLALVGCGQCQSARLCERCNNALLRMAMLALSGHYPKEGFRIFGGYHPTTEKEGERT